MTLPRLSHWLAVVLVFGLLGSLIPVQAAPEQFQTITVSGALRHDGSPVAGVEVHLIKEGWHQTVMTDEAGAYRRHEVPAGGWLQIFVRPTSDRGLAFRNWAVDDVAGDIIKDFDMLPGVRFQGSFEKPDGGLFASTFWLGMEPVELLVDVPPDEWIGETVFDGQFDMMVPPGLYHLFPTPPPEPFFMPGVAIDLTGADVTREVITLMAEPADTAAAGAPVQIDRTDPAVWPVLPLEPPDAALITIGEADTDGTAAVSGAAGAVPANTLVFVANVSAHTYAVVSADDQGAFDATLYAPNGSYVLVKYDPLNEVLNAVLRHNSANLLEGDEINELPGTMLLAGTLPESPSSAKNFSQVGAFSEEPNSWAGWQLTGTLAVPADNSGYGLTVWPGQVATVNARLRVTVPGMNCTGTPPYRPMGHALLAHQFDAAGYSHPWGMWFTSNLFTPTGLPIEHEAGVQHTPLASAPITGLTCLTPDTLEGRYQLTFTVPNLEDGIYIPAIYIDRQEIPLAADQPQIKVWYDFDPAADLAPLVIRQTAEPRIPWTLLANYPINGHRGVQAREDAGTYEMPTRVVTPPHRAVIPRMNPHTGEPYIYQLEPGSQWLSSTDRRQPNPPHVPLITPSGELIATIAKPDGSTTVLGPSPIRQTWVQTPATPGGDPLAHGTGQIADMYHLATMDDAFAYQFDQYGRHTVTLSGSVMDVYGYPYAVGGTYDLYVAEVLDLDPAQLPTTPYVQGDSFAAGLHIFPPVPAEVTITVTHLPNSDPTQAVVYEIGGRANRYGYFQPAPGDAFTFEVPGEFRVDISADYVAADGTIWMGAMTWGGVVEGTTTRIAAHGRRGMDYEDDLVDDMPAWFEVFNLPENKVGIENYYPYFSGDIHWGNEDRQPGDSIHTLISIQDLTPDNLFYNILREHWPRNRNSYRWPPSSELGLEGLNMRIAIGEAPLIITTASGADPALYPEDIDLWAYYYGSSQRPDVRVREIITEDNMGTAYWRFDDTYGYQIGESAEGDLPGDLKWEFGGAVFRVSELGINEYAVYSSLWVLLPHGDPVGARVTPPFQDATGASINGGPIMTLLGEDIDMLFLPKGIRPGDVLEIGDTVAFSGHVGPPLDSQVSVTITTPSGRAVERVWYANKIGWLYDPTFDFVAEEAGRWTVDVAVLHDRPYVGNGVIPQSHNTGTVLGTTGRYEFYVVAPNAPRLTITAPQPGIITWPEGIEPIAITGIAPEGTTAVHYTIHDKGTVMDQGVLTPAADGTFTLLYDTIALHADFPFLSLTAHEGRWPGLADEVAITLLAVGDAPQANTVTLIGEQVFVGNE
jgi:hypothetical protein